VGTVQKYNRKTNTTVRTVQKYNRKTHTTLSEQYKNIIEKQIPHCLNSPKI
jgi:hypothetical protein